MGRIILLWPPGLQTRSTYKTDAPKANGVLMKLSLSFSLSKKMYHVAVKAYQVPTCTGTRSPILLRLVCGRTPVATLGMWADPGRALSVGSGAKRRVGSDIGKHTIKNCCNHD